MLNLIKTNIMVLLLSNLASFLNYGFQFILARKLTVQEFGVFNSSFSFAVLLTSVYGFLPVFTSRYTIRMSNDSVKRSLFLNNWFFFVTFSIILLDVLLIIFQKQILKFLNHQTFMPILIAITCSSLTSILMFAQGVLQGIGKHVLMMWYGIFFPVGKIIFLYLLYISGYLRSANEATACILIAAIIPTLLTYRFIIKNGILNLKLNSFRQIFNSVFNREAITFITPTAATLFFISYLTSIDVLLVKKNFSDEIAGNYIAISLVGKISLFLASSLVPVFFSRVLKKEMGKISSIDELVTMILITVLIVGLYLTLILLFPEKIMGILFGSQYSVNLYVIPWIAFGMGGVSILNLITHFFLAKNMFSFLIPCFFACIFLFILQTLNSLQISLVFVPMSVCITIYLTLFVCFIQYYLKTKRS